MNEGNCFKIMKVIVDLFGINKDDEIKMSLI